MLIYVYVYFCYFNALHSSILFTYPQILLCGIPTFPLIIALYILTLLVFPFTTPVYWSFSYLTFSLPSIMLYSNNHILYFLNLLPQSTFLSLHPPALFSGKSFHTSYPSIFSGKSFHSTWSLLVILLYTWPPNYLQLCSNYLPHCTTQLLMSIILCSHMLTLLLLTIPLLQIIFSTSKKGR
ncbi:hypothetical protein K435DRAFT_460784 [Dendrothele bispora CBS 962.96]|uniref:Uncharacterized protein n=1 Tax=Dendrothele bispora (strain CBS 962.96) TaxID=1314807 RepID=A0A4S8L1Q5_DENBC|nr:hypothetical protein K435DRAFT_460784 [Dendrothele bispora CBS 962.96]